ncbi:MAG: molybdopterin-dependent oxidoreductase [Rubrivivax sp.]|nr:molybdopterin-dependent oxidoreductase [Rubrivivax sp.]
MNAAWVADPARRRLLFAAGAGLSVSFTAGCSLPVIPKRPAPEAADAAGWVRHIEGRWQLWLPRVEMGQNIATALKQIACEELGIGWAELELRLPATGDIRRVRATVGSESVKDFALPLARACATLREAVAAGSSEGELVARDWPPEQLRSLNGQGRRHVGGMPALEQGQAIVRGAPLYVSDVRRPGQLYGRVLRAPASPELASRLAAADEAAARAVPGFVALVRDARLLQGNAEGLGIVARTPGALDRIEAALAAQWQVEGAFDQAQLDTAIDIDRRLAASMRRDKQLHAQSIDTSAAWDVDLRIDVPLAAHAAIEPRAALAEFDAHGRLQLWVGSQDVFYQRDVLAKRLGLDEDRVLVHGRRVGGAFGGKTICTVELEAALLARAVGAPVKVQWTRAQEFGQAFHRPPSSHRIRVRVRDGRIVDWWHAFASSHIIFTSAGFPPWLQRLADWVGDPGVARGAEPPYRMQARHIGFDAVRLPVHTGPWRGLGAGPNVFAIECAIDECARAAGADALAFRLAHIEDPRLARVLEQVARSAAWPQRVARSAARPQRPASGGTLLRGRGIACGIYKAMSYAAVVAEVEVDAADASVKVTRLWCAHDCGRVINPDQVRAQCEGNLVWGLGMVLVERLPVAGSRIAASSFAEAPIVRAGQVPPMQIEVVDEGHAPSGAGETAIVAAGAAIANALRDACGLRLQRLPLQQADLRAALGKSP